MASQKEKASIRSFVCKQLRAEPDLSVLTVKILKKRYLAKVKSDTLSEEAAIYLKKVVEKEITKMLDNGDIESDVENKVAQNKRKREEENEETEGNESTAKRTRLRSNPSEDSGKDESMSSEPDEETDGNDSESEKDEQEGKISRQKNDKHESDSEDSSGEETVKSVKTPNEKHPDDSPSKTPEKEKDRIKKEKPESDKPSQGKTASQSESEDDSDNDGSSHKNDNNKSSSSSDESGEEEDPKDEKTKQKQKKGSVTNDKKPENKAIARLKRYIVLCGVRRNYKKLFSNSKSLKSKIDVLKKELEDIGIKGAPTIQKCKQLKMKREQEREVAELDVTNIITTEGRSRRRGTTAHLEQVTCLTNTHVRSLNSDSESNDESNSRHKRKTDWSNLRGVISDDASSD